MHWFTTNHMLLIEPSWPFFKRNLGLLSSSCSRLVLRNNWNPSAVSEKEKRWSNRPCFKKQTMGNPLPYWMGDQAKRGNWCFKHGKGKWWSNGSLGTYSNGFLELLYRQLEFFALVLWSMDSSEKKIHTDKRNCHHLPFSSPPIRTKSTFATWSLSSWKWR